MSDAAAWDREATTFDVEPDHGLRDDAVRQAWWRLLTAELPPVPARIVDLGCGTGSLAVLLAQHAYTVSAVDFSSEMLARASRKASDNAASVDLVRGDAARPPLRRGAFDAVVCRHVLWAIDDIDGTLAEWGQLLRPHGRMLLIEGQWSTGAGLPPEDIADALRRLGRRAAIRPLTDQNELWGRAVDDDRYMVLS